MNMVGAEERVRFPVGFSTYKIHSHEQHVTGQLVIASFMQSKKYPQCISLRALSMFRWRKT